MISTINVPKSYLTLEHQSCADDVRLLAELRTYSGSRQRKESREDFTLGDTFDGSRIDTGGSRIETPMKS